MIATWNGEELDLAPDQFPAFTFRADNIDDISSVSGNKATTLTVPATNRNRSILGGPHMAEQSGTTGVFRVQEGGALMFNGVGYVIERSEAGYAVSIVGGNASWAAALGDKRMRGIDMGVSDAIGRSMMKDTWTNETSALYFPVVDFGNLENRPGTDDVSLTYLRPGIRIKPFVEAAYSDAGFSIVADGAFDALWPKLVMPNTSDSIPISDGYLDASSARFDKETQQPIDVIVPSFQEITYPTVTTDQGSTYTGTGRYTAPYNETANIKARIRLSSQLYGGTGVISVRVRLWDYTAGVQLFSDKSYTLSQFSPDTEDEFVFGTADLISGHQYGIEVKGTRLLTTTAQMAVDSGYFEVSVQDVPYQPGVTIDIGAQAPDIKVTDIVKWVAMLFCIDIETRGSVVTLRFYDDLHRPPDEGYRDLTDRISWVPVKSTDPQPSAFVFRHKRDDKDRLVEDNRSRLGEFAAGNHRQDVGGYDDVKEVEIGFAATEMADVLDAFRVPALRDIDGEANISGIYPDTYRWDPRILIADGVGEASWSWGGVTEAEYPVCYSYPQSVNGSYSATFGNMVQDRRIDATGVPGTVSRYWHTKIRRFTDPKLDVPVLWHDHEVMLFDRRKPVKCSDGYDDAFYYVQMIDQHLFGQGAVSRTVLLKR